MNELASKYVRLKELLRGCGKLAVAFSGGVDSTLLLHAATQALGAQNVLAITAKSALFPDGETQEAVQFCEQLDVRQLVFESDELALDDFADNPPERCYICKKHLFANMLKLAVDESFSAFAEGTNASDVDDFRPGMKALSELGILSPLREAGLTKSDIRDLLCQEGLPIWSKPSYACLASRVPYGETITAEKLHAVEQTEEVLHKLGFVQSRVRVHEEANGALSARIEVLPQQIAEVLAESVRQQVLQQLKNLGFAYVSVDMQGYRTGSLNEALGESLDAALDGVFDGASGGASAETSA